jgi:hypothetical protein
MTDQEIITIAHETTEFPGWRLINFARAIEAARATAEQSTFALQMLAAAGHVSQAKIDEVLSIAATTPGIRAPEEQSRDSAELQFLKDAGFKMSNIFFNLAQRPGEALGAEMCKVLDTCRKEWDDAVRALKQQLSG